MRSEPVPGPEGEPSGTVFNIQRFSIEDGPGIRTTVFMKGCPLRCVWCHNPEGLVMRPQLMWFDVRCIGARDCISACEKSALELTSEGMKIDRQACDACGRCQEACPAGALEVVGREYSPGEVFDEVFRDEVFYRKSGGGVTISGGEPAMQPEFVEAVMKRCREGGLHVALDTSACAPRDVLARLVGLADLVLVDLKVMDPERHLELTGVRLEPILENAKMVARSGKPVWIRTPIIPGCTDTEENLRALASFIKDELRGVRRYDILAFNNTCGAKYRRLDMEWTLEESPLIEKGKMDTLARIAKGSGVERVTWAGATRGS